MKKWMSMILALAIALTLAACGGNEEPEQTAAPLQLDAAQLYGKLGDAVQLPEMLQLNESLMLDYCGIQAADVKQAVVAICADSLRTDEIWVLEAVDEAAASRLVELANKRLTKKGEESITYSPEQYAVVEKAQLLQNGSYVILLVSPDAASLAAAVETNTGAQFRKVNN